MKYAVTQMMKQDPLPSGERGWIVNIASIGGQIGLPLERKSNATATFVDLEANTVLQLPTAPAREQSSTSLDRSLLIMRHIKSMSTLYARVSWLQPW